MGEDILTVSNACIYLVGVETPEVELLFKERTTHVGRVVQLPGAVVVEDLREDARVSVEKPAETRSRFHVPPEHTCSQPISRLVPKRQVRTDWVSYVPHSRTDGDFGYVPLS